MALSVCIASTFLITFAWQRIEVTSSLQSRGPIAVPVSAESSQKVHGESSFVWPGKSWVEASPEEVGLNPSLLMQSVEFAGQAGGAGMIIRHGKLIGSWGNPKEAYDLKSTGKSIGITSLGLALMDGKVSLDDRARRHFPGLGADPAHNQSTGWLDDIRLFHLATQTAGFEKPGGYSDLVFPPGTHWAYSDAGPNWLADCMTWIYQRDLQDLLRARIFRPIGIADSQLWWRTHRTREEELDSIPRREFGGVWADVDAMARIGLLYLREGAWQDEVLLPRDFIRTLRRPSPAVAKLPVHPISQAGYADAPRHYGLLWWNNAEGLLDGVPRDAFWSWGLYDSYIVCIPSLDLVVVRAGPPPGWGRGLTELLPTFLRRAYVTKTPGPSPGYGGDLFEGLEAFLQPIVSALEVEKSPQLPMGVHDVRQFAR